MNEKWHAVYTRPRWEKKVAENLSVRNFVNYCPVNRVVKQWSDRKKIIYEPLFTSYVFVHVTEKQHSEIRQIDGILNFVYWLGKPAIIKEAEIETIKVFLNEYGHVRLEKANFNINDTIKIIRGPLIERDGIVVAVKSNTLKVALPSLGYLMYAEVEKSYVEVVDKKDYGYAAI